MKKKDIEWIRASSSMPIVSNVVEIDGRGYLDGGISDSIPLKFFEDKGYDKNIVITTQPYDYVKPEVKKKKAMKIALKKTPAIYDAMMKRHLMYNEEVRYIKEKEKEGDVLVIRPKDTLPINRISHDPDEMTLVYNIGRDIAEENIEKIKEYLG